MGAKELFGGADGQILRHIHDLAAAVVALAGVPLGVLVGHHRTDGLEDCLGNEVLGGDQLEVARLAYGFLADRLGDVGIDLLESVHARPLARDGARSISAILSTRRARAPPANEVSSQARRISSPVSRPVSRPASASTLASLCSRLIRAVKTSPQRAARIPGTLLAAMAMPIPVPQTRTPRSTLPTVTASATWMA